MVGLTPLFQETHQCVKDTVQGGPEPPWVVAHLKWGGDWDTLLMLYRVIICSKLDYGCVVYGTASNTNLRQLDSIHNTGLRLALGAFCTSPVSSLYAETNEAPLEERSLKLSINYYLKTCLHWKSGTSCPARIRPNHQRYVCPQAKWARRHVPTPNTSCRSPGWGSRGICGDKCWFDLPLEATKLPIRNTQIRPVKTQPHWRSKQMYDFQRRSQSQIQWVLWHSRTTWWSLYRWIQDRRESGYSSGHQPPFPEWWDNLLLLIQETPG